MNIYSDGQSRVLNGAFPKRFRLLNGDKEVPFIRTGADSIRLSGKLPVGDLLVEEIVKEAVQKKEPLFSNTKMLIMTDQDINKIEKIRNDFEEKSQQFNDAIDTIGSIVQEVSAKYDENAQSIAVMDQAVSGIVENLQKEIDGSIKQSNDIRKQLSKIIDEKATDLSDSLVAHENANNPHRITKATIGLDKVENISPDDMPVSKATKKALEKKADKDDIKSLQGKLDESKKTQDNIAKGIARLNWVGGVGGSSDIPSGGTTGQVLAKRSDATGDYTWVDPESGLKIVRVDSLPVSGETGTLYLVPSSDPELSNIYDEYIWTDDGTGTLAWEKIGTTEIDLSGYVKDVKVNGSSIVDGSTQVAVIPIAQQNGDYGLIKLRTAAYGLGVDSSGYIIINRASTTDIDEKDAYYKPITPINLDYAVKRGIAYNGLTLTDTEKASACSLVGALPNNIYGESTTAASTVQKEVSIPSITSLNAGQLIIVQPTVTSTVANSTLKLNDFSAYPMLYNGAAITTSTDSIVWNAACPTWFLFNGTNWVFMGHGVDSNTTYNSSTFDLLTAGANTTNRLISPVVYKDSTYGAVTSYASGDTITPADKYLYNSTSNISALTIVAPSSPDVRYMAQINMSSGSTATTLTYPSTFKVLEGCDDVQYIAGVRTFVPEANKRYQIFIENDGVNTVLWAKGV